jgi:hypothetical protein
MHMLQFKKDYYAGGLMVLIGLGMALKGPSYRTGTLMHMGPGFMPTALGVILVFLGILIALSAVAVPLSEEDRILPEHPQWWGWFCILAGPVLFIWLGSGDITVLTFAGWTTLFSLPFKGLIPGTFACVFMSSLGDKTSTWLGSVGLATVVTIFGVGLFSYVLKVPMPILEWRGF